MSPRAAVRLRRLGFARVYDYAGGKNDWLAAALPVEGERGEPTAGDALVRNAPTCRIDDRVETAAARHGDWPFCVVVDDDGTVLGLLRPDARGDTVADAMEPGPTTVRGSEPLEPLLDAVARSADGVALVTDPDGRLLGAVRSDRR